MRCNLNMRHISIHTYSKFITYFTWLLCHGINVKAFTMHGALSSMLIALSSWHSYSIIHYSGYIDRKSMTSINDCIQYTTSLQLHFTTLITTTTNNVLLPPPLVQSHFTFNQQSSSPVVTCRWGERNVSLVIECQKVSVTWNA